MAKGKLILICQSGGEFVTEDDGTMSYSGGEANAENITSETPFSDLKLKVAEVCNLNQKTVTFKYFLPGNKKNLIVIKNDKDLKRMIDFHGDAITAEVFVMGTPGFDQSALDIEPNRESGIKKDEKLKKDEALKKGNVKKTKKDSMVATTDSPAKRTRRATAAAKVSSGDNQAGSTDKSDSATSDSGDETSSSDSSDRGDVKADPGSDSSSDYTPRRSSYQKKHNTPSASPADSVKKRRRTPSWKFGANGRPTIVSFPGKSQGQIGKGESSQRKSSRLAAKGESSKETKERKKARVSSSPDTEQESEPEENLTLTVCDDYALTETMVDTWKSAITGVGQEFDSVNEFRAALKKYAIANRFGYRFKKNDTSRAIGGCAAEGCTWKFYAVWVPTNQSFMIKTLNNVHTCDKGSRKSAHPAKNWLVGTIKDRLRESPYLKPKEIANGILQDFGVELNYTQVWRGIGDARELLHGSLKESYNKLPWFCEKILETNPGSVAKLVIGDKKRFKSLFVSFHALIHGFKNGCRPLLFLEAVSMKSRYGETLMLAIAIDGNDGFIPVAFAVVDVEDDDTWRWFLEELKASILNKRVITFVFDKDKNLKKTVLEVFENAYIGYSIFHLLASFKRHMKGPFHGDGKAFLTVHFLAAAHAVRPIGFKKSTEHIKMISSQAHDWFVQIEPENYASSYFKGERYNHITEDVGESYAKLMEDYRHLPIIQKLDALIRTMMDDVLDAKLDASMWATHLTALKEKELEQEKVRARGLKVLISSDTLFEVREESTHVVNIGNWSCTCMGWKETGLPCCHAVAVFFLTGKNPYDFCSSFFTADAYRETYSESIHPVPIDGPPLENKKQVEGGKMVVRKDESVKMDGEKDEGSNVEGTEECEKMEIEKDEGVKLDGEKDEGSNVECEKEEGVKEDRETEGGNTEEGEKMEVQKYEGSNIGAEKEEGLKEDHGMEGGNMEEGEKVEVQKDDSSNVDAEKEEDLKEDHAIEGGNMEEGEKVEVQKDDSSNVDAEKEEDLKEDHAIEGDNMEEDEKLEVQKDEGVKLDGEKDEGSNVDAEKEEGVLEVHEMEEGEKMEVQKDEGGNVEQGRKLDGEKEEGEKLDGEKDEGGNVDTEKLDGKKDEGGNVDTGKDEGLKLEGEKDEGGKVREEYEDPNVFVLPPIPVKGTSSMVKKEMEGVENEGEMKRKVTCSKCKQPGHYKKSCKIEL